MFNGARILVAPLDWGLGHATRCIPIIERLKELRATPVIGADGNAYRILKHAFPLDEMVRIPGPEIHYSTGRGMAWSMTKQFPGMLRGIRREHAFLKARSAALNLDAVISDQRFGLRSRTIPSVLVTHQLHPFVPFGTGLLRRFNHAMIERFDRCWVMDHAEPPGLAGALSHGPKQPSNVRYIGPLSRVRPMAGVESKRWDVVAIISGPEPQRSILEDILLRQLDPLPGDHLLVQGLPGSASSVRKGTVRLVPHLDREELTAAMSNARLIVARSGFSTIMDLVAMGLTALLIPTPGQPEQEYLARLHHGSGRFLVQDQGSIDLNAALDRDRSGAQVPDTPDTDLLTVAMKDLAHCLR